MSIQLIVNNTSFDYPEQGEQSPWGEAATGWAVEVTKALNSLNGPSDILETSGNIANNQVSLTDISSFFFDSTTVQSFSVKGNIVRVGSSTLYEEFTLNGLNIGTGWLLTQEGIGESGVTFSITNAGQVQYTSTNLAGQTSGKIKFKGIGILKA